MAAYLWFVQLQTTNGRLFTYGTNYTIYGWWLRLLHLMAMHKWHSKVLELQFMISVWSLVHGCRVLAYVLPSYCWWGFYQVWLIMLMRQYTVTNLVSWSSRQISSVCSLRLPPRWPITWLVLSLFTDNSPSAEPPATAEKKEEAEKSDHEGEQFNIETE